MIFRDFWAVGTAPRHPGPIVIYGWAKSDNEIFSATQVRVITLDLRSALTLMIACMHDSVSPLSEGIQPWCR